MPTKPGLGLLALLILGNCCVLAADKPTAGVDAEVKQWQGAWRAVSFEHEGQPTPADKLAKIKLTVDGSNYHFENGDFHERGIYQFDPSKNPKALDIHVGDGADKGKVYQVIYKFEADKLIICLHSDNKQRPNAFTGKVDSGNVLETWERVKP